MTRLELALLVDWAGTLRSRKRMQKVVYLLMAAGCPLEAEFQLHHYGPYSAELAALCDGMTRAGLLREETEARKGGASQYAYRLTEKARGELRGVEGSGSGSGGAGGRRGELEGWRGLAERLLERDLKELEIASTILYFRREGREWGEAIARTSAVKRIDGSGDLMMAAAELAQSIAEGGWA